LHFLLLRSTLDRCISHSYFEDYCELFSLNLVFVVKMRKRSKLHSRCSRVSLASNEVAKLGATSHFFIMNIEIDFQILRLFGREIGAFVQEIILVGQMICFVNFALYQGNKLSSFDKLYYSH